MSESGEQIIGGKPKPFFIPESTKPSTIEPFKPVERPKLPGANGNEPIIDFTSMTSEKTPEVAFGNESTAPKRFSDTLKSLEDCVEDPQERKKLQDVAADFVQHRDDHRGVAGVLRSIPDLTQREYLAALIARYTALEASRQPGGAVENDIAWENFEKNKRVAFPKPERVLQGV